MYNTPQIKIKKMFPQYSNPSPHESKIKIYSPFSLTGSQQLDCICVCLCVSMLFKTPLPLLIDSPSPPSQTIIPTDNKLIKDANTWLLIQIKA